MKGWCIIASTDYAGLLVKGIRKNYDIMGQIYPLQGKELFHVKDSSNRYEQEQNWIPYGLPGSRLDGEPVLQGAFAMDFNRMYVHTNFGLGDVIPQEAIDDDVYGMMVKWAAGRGSSMAEAYVTLQEIQAANYFANVGFASGTGVLGSPDGVAIFSTSHPTSAYNANPLSNTPATATDLSMAGLQAARANLEQQPKANGVTIQRNNIVKLVVNPNIKEIALQLQKGEWTPGTTDRNMNTIQNTFEVFSWPYWRKSGAASATAFNSWFVQGEEHQMVWYDREAVSFDQQKLVNIRSILFASFMRFTLGHSGWRGMYGSVAS